MNYFVLYTIIFILILGWIFEKSSFLTYAIMIVFFVMISFSYDTYDYLQYKKMYDNILWEDTLGYELIYECLLKAGNYLGLTFEQFRMFVVGFEIILMQLAIRRIAGTNAFIWSMFIVYPGWILVPLLRFAFGFSFVLYGCIFLIEEQSDNSTTGKTMSVRSRRLLNSFYFLLFVAIASLIHSSFWGCAVLVLVKFLDQKKLLWIISFVVLVFFIVRSPQAISSILSFLPIRLYKMEKIQDSTARNFNGLLFNTLKQGVIFSFGYLAVTTYQSRKKIIDSSPKIEELFMKSVLPVNYVSILFLVIAIFSSSPRLTFLTITYNLIACGICVKNMSDNLVKKTGLKICALAFCMLLSVLMCKIESKDIFNFILVMIFETNDVFNM